MEYTIIEDSSPFYIKFTHAGHDRIIDISREELKKVSEVKTFLNYTFSIDVGKQILNLFPLSKKISFQQERVSLFISAPGYKHYVHIDGALVSVNYGINIVDNTGITNWYADDDIVNNFRIYPNLPLDRAIIERSAFDKNKQLPVKSFIHKQQEAIIFNSSKYHNFDNSNSKEYRAILTLRTVNRNITFEDLKKIMFED
jgi:hypothetical protein